MYHNSSLYCILNSVGFTLKVFMFIFLMWSIISAWKIAELSLGESKALLLFAIFTIVVMILSYI